MVFEQEYVYKFNALVCTAIMFKSTRKKHTKNGERKNQRKQEKSHRLKAECDHTLSYEVFRFFFFLVS